MWDWWEVGSANGTTSLLGIPPPYQFVVVVVEYDLEVSLAFSNLPIVCKSKVVDYGKNGGPSVKMGGTTPIVCTTCAFRDRPPGLEIGPRGFGTKKIGPRPFIGKRW